MSWQYNYISGCSVYKYLLYSSTAAGEPLAAAATLCVSQQQNCMWEASFTQARSNAAAVLLLPGVPFVDVLRKEGIVPGIKADTGMQVRHTWSNLVKHGQPWSTLVNCDHSTASTCGSRI